MITTLWASNLLLIYNIFKLKESLFHKHKRIIFSVTMMYLSYDIISLIMLLSHLKEKQIFKNISLLNLLYFKISSSRVRLILFNEHNTLIWIFFSGMDVDEIWIEEFYLIMISIWVISSIFFLNWYKKLFT